MSPYVSTNRLGGCRSLRTRDADLARQAKLWGQKWRWYQRNELPWRRARIHWHLMRREAFARWPLHGEILEMLDEGRLEIGAGALLEPDVWLTPRRRGASASARGRSSTSR